MNHSESGENKTKLFRMQVLLNAFKVFSSLPSDAWPGLKLLIINRFQVERNNHTLKVCTSEDAS